MIQEKSIERLIELKGFEKEIVKVKSLAKGMGKGENDDSTKYLRILMETLKVLDLTEVYNKIRLHVVQFLHQPFPTFELFRTLAARLSFLEGLLCSDLIGFHSFDHARHFLTACRRSVGVKSCSRRGGNLGVQFMGRNVMVTVAHVGIEPTFIEASIKSPACEAVRRTVGDMYPDKQIIVGVDFCDRMSGVALKLLAWEMLLAEAPQYRSTAVLVQRCVKDSVYVMRDGDVKRSMDELQVCFFTAW